MNAVVKGRQAFEWRVVVWVISWVMSAALVFGAGESGGPETPFETGNQLFKEGKFEEAERAYNRQLAVNGDSAAVRFNLGKVREALGDPGGALLEWERAFRIEPGHRASAEAAGLVRRSLGVQGSNRSWWGVIPSFVRGRETWVVALGGWGVVAAGLGIGLGGWRGRGWLLGGICLALIACGLFWMQASAWAMEEAVIRERAVSARKAPADPAPSLGEYPAGTIVRILGVSAGWSRVRLPDGRIGWVSSGSVERISSGF